MKKVIIMFLFVLMLCSCQIHEHKFGEWNISQQPTCTEYGIMERTCECGECETRPMEPFGHVADLWEIKNEATCTEDGLEQKKCSKCGEILEERTIEASHTPSEWINDIEATCLTGGHRHRICSICGETIDDEDYPALGHTKVVDKGYAATCSKDGMSDGSHCSVCGEILSFSEPIKAQGHKYSNGICTICGKEETYGLGDTYTVDNQWEITIDSVKKHYLCWSSYNEQYDQYDEVVLINYHYKNLGYSKELFISDAQMDVFDQEMETGSHYLWCTHETFPDALSISGTSCSATVAFLLPHESSEITIAINPERMVINGNRKSAIFIVPVSN